MPNILTKSQQELFYYWYRFYPHKKAVGAAEKAWVKLNPDAPLVSKMVHELAGQKIERQHKLTNGHFVPDWPYPATWLNGRRWEDEPDIVKSRQERQDEIEASRPVECPSCRHFTLYSGRCSECGFSR